MEEHRSNSLKKTKSYQGEATEIHNTHSYVESFPELFFMLSEAIEG